MTIEVQFENATTAGSCMGCGIRQYEVAKLYLGRLEVRLCDVCARTVFTLLSQHWRRLREIRSKR